MSLAPVLARIDADLEQSVERLFELLKIPSYPLIPSMQWSVKKQLIGLSTNWKS